MRSTRLVPAFLFACVLGVIVSARAPFGVSSSGAAEPCVGTPAYPAALDTSRHVIHVSVDGLRADAVQRLGAAVPNFRRMRIEGTFSENARTDYDYTVTLPNHACELTSRPVLEPEGHGVSFNTDDPRTIAEVHGAYVEGAFDVAHDYGLRTFCCAGKSKFEIFDRSWNETNGASDSIAPDDGRDKIDAYIYNADPGALFASLLDRMASQRYHYAFFHFSRPDDIGHIYGWESKEYFDAVVEFDGYLGRIFDLVESDSALAGDAWIVIVSDHGGIGFNHSLASEPANYTIPLYIWGPGVSAGADLYGLNPASRLDPGAGRPDHAAVPQPIRNAETANICLDILGCPAIAGSTFNAAQNLALAPSGGLPCVWIDAPEAGSIFAYPSEVAIEATARGGLGGVAYVEFFVNGELLGTDDSVPYTYAWSGAPVGVYRVTARAVSGGGAAAAATVAVEISGVTDVSRTPPPVAPPRAYPNPAGRRSTISFELSAPRAAEIRLYDILGRRIETLFRGYLPRGAHTLSFDAAVHLPGLYVYEISAGDETQRGKIVIVR